jgi:uncharacterized membrane protein HdeD (DUF308 family)
MMNMYLPEALSEHEAREPRSLLTQEARYWYVLALAGLIAIGVGVLVLADPARSLKTLAVILGVYFLIAGTLLIVRTASDQDRGVGGMFLGMVALIAGLIVIRHPGQSIVAVALTIGIYFVVAGALDLARAITGPRRLLSLVRGVVLVAAGCVITASPEISVKTLALVTGIAICMQGAVQIWESLVLRSLSRGAPH